MRTQSIDEVDTPTTQIVINAIVRILRLKGTMKFKPRFSGYPHVLKDIVMHNWISYNDGIRLTIDMYLYLGML